MKTKYSAILNIKKNALQQQERKLLENQNKIANKQRQIAQLNDELHNLQIPQSGDFMLFSAFERQKYMVLGQIDIAKEELEALEIQKATLTHLYKESSVDYEKIKFLDTKIVESKLQQLRKQEEHQIDEVALMLYNNGGQV